MGRIKFMSDSESRATRQPTKDEFDDGMSQAPDPLAPARELARKWDRDNVDLMDCALKLAQVGLTPGDAAMVMQDELSERYGEAYIMRIALGAYEDQWYRHRIHSAPPI